MSIKIDTNIPIPAHKSRSGITNTLRKMAIGHSILLPHTQAPAIASIAQRIGIKTLRRRQPDGQYRIWRIE
jgi:hypothetical protein